MPTISKVGRTVLEGVNLTCAAECSFDAIGMNHHTGQQIVGQVDAMLMKTAPEFKILVFACNSISPSSDKFRTIFHVA